MPTGREEEWRFTPLRRLRDLPGDAPLADGEGAGGGDAAPGVARGAGRTGRRQGRPLVVPADRVSARAFASFGEATVITVPAETVASRPTVVTVAARAARALRSATCSSTCSRWRRPWWCSTTSGSATYADNVELVVGDGASLTVVSLQDWADDAVHVSHHHARLGRDATVRHVAVTLGGGLVRLAPTVRYAGPGGDAELLGMYFADAGQHLEHRLFVDHASPTAAAGSTTRARCRATTRTRCGSATC